MGVNYTEADYENSVIELFRDQLGYEYIYGPDIERDFYSPLYDSILEESLYSLNRNLPSDAIQDAMYKLKNFENGELVQKNSVFMDYLQNGIPEVRTYSWTPKGVKINVYQRTERASTKGI